MKFFDVFMAIPMFVFEVLLLFLYSLKYTLACGNKISRIKGVIMSKLFLKKEYMNNM